MEELKARDSFLIFEWQDLGSLHVVKRRLSPLIDFDTHSHFHSSAHASTDCLTLTTLTSPKVFASCAFTFVEVDMDFRDFQSIKFDSLWDLQGMNKARRSFFHLSGYLRTTQSIRSADSLIWAVEPPSSLRRLSSPPRNHF